MFSKSHVREVITILIYYRIDTKKKKITYLRIYN